MALQFYNSVSKKIQLYLTENNITPRKDAGPGIWLSFLLPSAVLLGEIKNKGTSHTYKTAASISCGFFLHTVIFLAQANNNNFFSHTSLIVPCFLSTLLLFYLTSEGIILSVIVGVLIISAYHSIVLPLMKLCPRSFSYGEATVVSQGLLLFLVCSFIKDPFGSGNCMDSSTILLQIVVISVLGLGAAAYHFNLKKKPKEFYSLLIVAAVTMLLPPLYFLGVSPIKWIISLIIEDETVMYLVLYWLVCSVFGVLAVYLQIKSDQKANTIVRKTFHILIVLVYAPGIVLRPCFLYLASGIVFALFVALDMVRILQMPPLGHTLQLGFMKFADEKDEGPLALTPIYLLVGCSVPLWVHPMPEASELLPLIAGILSIGIGDSAASICGTLVGKNKWPGSTKTKEGTAACFLSQLFLVIALIHFGYIPRMNLIQPTFAIALGSIVEAKTDQVDNLALPLLMYVMTL